MTEFDARHAAIRFTRLESIAGTLQEFEEARLAHKKKVRCDLIQVLSELPLAGWTEDWVADGADYILEAYFRSEYLDAPLSRNGGWKTALRELSELGEIAERLTNLVNSMHRDTLVAIGGRDKSPIATASDLLRMSNKILDCCLVASECFPATVGTADPPAEKKRARAVTMAAIYVYEGLTEQRATRNRENQSKHRDPRTYGATKDYLQRIFDLLEIDAKAEGQLKAVLPRLKDDAFRPKAKCGKVRRQL